jgi:tetratricopeptide (TPR) repeat protein
MWSVRHLATLALLLSLPGCSKRDEPVPAPSPCVELDAGAAVAPALLGFLSAARSAHHKADLLEQNRDVAGATRALEELLAAAKPAGTHPEVNEVLSDTHARLADLYGRQGQMAQAERSIGAGLELAREPTYFRGHLFEVRGVLEERHAETLAKAGKTEEARQARERAISAFEEAMRIQKQVIEGAAPGRP